METFTLQGQALAYVDEVYNNTRLNERCVEVAVALHLIAKAASVLEVGCVMPHYLPNLSLVAPAASPDGAGVPAGGTGGANDAYTVVDLYEQFEGVINEDVLTYQPERLYDLVLCISTLDHLHSPGEVLAAIRRMKGWRTLGGLLLVTLPFGQPAWIGGGPWLDALLGSRFQMGASALWRMDKIDPWHHLWEEVAIFPDHPPGRAYNGVTAWANSVYFLLYGDVEQWWSKQPFPFRNCSQEPTPAKPSATSKSGVLSS